MSTQNEKLPTAVEFIHRLAYDGKIKGFEAASWDEIQEKFQPDVKSTPAPSAPAAMSITREEMIELADQAHTDFIRDQIVGGHKVVLTHCQRLQAMEAALSALPNVLPPAPPPPPQKSENEREAERIAEANVVIGGSQTAFGTGPEMWSYSSRDYDSVGRCIKHLIKRLVTAALDARDAEHRQRLAEKDHEMRGELEALAKTLTDRACQWYGDSHYVVNTQQLRDVLNEVLLTKAERSAAK